MCHRVTEAQHSDPAHCEPLKLVMQAADPHLGLQLEKKASRKLIKKNRSERNKGSGEVLERKTKPLAFDFCVSLLRPGSHPSRT